MPTLTPLKVKPGLELLQTSDSTFDFHVDGPGRFVLHFADPNAFGKKFAILEAGSNSFTLMPPTKKTCCYVWSETELAHILANWELPPEEQSVSTTQPRRTVVVEPMTPPIIIPPR